MLEQFLKLRVHEWVLGQVHLMDVRVSWPAAMLLPAFDLICHTNLLSDVVNSLGLLFILVLRHVLEEAF